MAIAHVQDIAVATVSSGTTLQSSAFPSSVTTGNTIIVVVLCWKGSTVSTSSVTDTAGNTYTQDQALNYSNVGGGNRANVSVWRSSNVTGGSTFKVTANTSASTGIVLMAAEFSGLASSSPLDGSGSTNFSNTGVTSLSTGVFSTTNANDLLLAVYGIDSTETTHTPPSGFTSFGRNLPGAIDGGEATYSIVSTTQTSINPTMTVSSTPTVYGAIGLAYKAGVTAYTLVASSRLFTLTGVVSSLLSARLVSSVKGIFAFAGDTVSLIATRKILSSTGSFIVTGNSSSLDAGYRLTSSVGSFVFTGDLSSFQRSYLISPSIGVFLFTGDAATLRVTGGAVIPVAVWVEDTRGIMWVESNRPLVWPNGLLNNLPVTHTGIGYWKADYGDVIQLNMSVDQTLGNQLIFAGLSGDQVSTTSMTVSRWSRYGVLDMTFQGGLHLVPHFTGSTQDACYCVKSLSTGKILLSGYFFPGPVVFGLVRLNSDGSIDPTFGTSGYEYVDFHGTEAVARDMVVLASEKILLGGYTYNAAYDKTSFAIARFNSDGSPDLSFGSGTGRVEVDFGTGGGSDCSSLSIQSDGKILLAGVAYDTIPPTVYDFAIARLNSDGSIDNTFGTLGLVLFNDVDISATGAACITTDSLGRVIAGGGSQIDLSVGVAGANMIVRLLSNGSLDVSFGGGKGYISDSISIDGITPVRNVRSIAVDPSDRILAIVDTKYSTDTFLVTRYTTVGTVDITYGSNGAFGFPPLTGYPQPNPLRAFGMNSPSGGLFLTDGSIIIAGTIESGTTGTISASIKVSPTGQFDLTYGDSP